MKDRVNSYSVKPLKGKWRIYFLLILFVFVFGAVIYRLFLIQVVRHSFYTAVAQGQYEFSKKINPERGGIFLQDKDGSVVPLAINREYFKVYAVPREINAQTKPIVAQKLSTILGMGEKEIFEKIDKNDPYEPLKSKLDEKTAEQIKSLNLAGVYLASENWRWYPQGDLASQVVGFVGFQGNQKVGQYGLEAYYEKQLAGQPGFLKAERDALGQSIFTGASYDLQPAQNGDNLFLTIDPNIQFVAEQKLKAVLEKWQSPGGSVIITDPKTGAIRAMASFPNFNPNNYFQVEDISVFSNPAIQKRFEPGSIFKPITMAAGLDLNKVTPETTYTDTGSVMIDNHVITNAANRSYGLSSMTKVLEKSINTGAVFVQRTIGNALFRKYVEAFGLNQLTNVDLFGEVKGDINNLNEGSPQINFATASFGQGIAVTPLEIVSAIGAIANNGKLMRPYLVDKIVRADGQEEKTQPQMIRQVISPQAAAKLTAMLVSTVRNGYDKIKIKGYFIAGKTGTAQVPNENSRGYTDETIHSFVGYAPAYDPKFLIFLKMDKPKGINFASNSLAPTFAEIANYLFNYYEIPPEE